MNRASAITLIRDLLGFHSTLSDAIILRHLAAVQSDYENGDIRLPLPWFMLSNEANDALTLTANVATVNVPTGFITLEDDIPGWVKKDGVLLGELKRVAVRRFNITAKGSPDCFDLIGQQFIFAPVPEVTGYQVYIPFYKNTTVISNSGVTSHPWLDYFPILFAYETTMSIARALRDTSLQQMIQGKLADLKGAYIATVTERSVVAKELITNRGDE